MKFYHKFIDQTFLCGRGQYRVLEARSKTDMSQSSSFTTCRRTMYLVSVDLSIWFKIRWMTRSTKTYPPWRVDRPEVTKKQGSTHRDTAETWEWKRKRTSIVNSNWKRAHSDQSLATRELPVRPYRQMAASSYSIYIDVESKSNWSSNNSANMSRWWRMGWKVDPTVHGRARRACCRQIKVALFWPKYNKVSKKRLMAEMKMKGESEKGGARDRCECR